MNESRGGTGLRAGRYAAIDIGTVTCRMLVADVAESGLCELDRHYAITNLGAGVDATGLLGKDAMERVMCAIDRYLAVLAQYETSGHPHIETVVVATSAARDAGNAADFAALLAQRGLRLSVIEGKREAALSFLGASRDFPGENVMVVDIGGGSTEVIVGRAGSAAAWSHSFDIGCRRITEKFFHADPPADDEIARARAWTREAMAPFFAEARACSPAIDRLVAVAGTATSVVSIHEAMETYDASRVHKAVVSCEVLEGVYDRLRALSLDARKQVVGLDPGRASVIVAGLLILQNVMDMAAASSFTASESDILQGIVLDAASR